jgi:hypothetical protein
MENILANAQISRYSINLYNYVL